jgi:uncharacterized membrane protein YfcA
LAGVIGVWIGHQLRPAILDGAVGISMVGMSLWMLKPDTLDENDGKRTQKGVFLTTLVAFFIAEIGDKTQVATLALAAGYSNLFRRRRRHDLRHARGQCARGLPWQCLCRPPPDARDPLHDHRLAARYRRRLHLPRDRSIGPDVSL